MRLTRRPFSIRKQDVTPATKGKKQEEEQKKQKRPEARKKKRTSSQDRQETRHQGRFAYRLESAGSRVGAPELQMVARREHWSCERF